MEFYGPIDSWEVGASVLDDLTQERVKVIAKKSSNFYYVYQITSDWMKGWRYPWELTDFYDFLSAIPLKEDESMSEHHQLVREILKKENLAGFDALAREDELLHMSTEELEAILEGK